MIRFSSEMKPYAPKFYTQYNTTIVGKASASRKPR